MNRRKAMTASELDETRGNLYYNHYAQYLRSLALQMFKWHGLPASVNERFLEMALHGTGQCAIFSNRAGDIVCASGAPSGQLDIYGEPTHFQPVYQNGQHAKTIELFNFLDEAKDTKNKGVLVLNNDYKTPTLPAIHLFARDMAHIKQVIQINVNNQKTPYLVSTSDKQLMSTLKALDQIENMASVIKVNEKMSTDAFNVTLTPAPFVTDRLNNHLMHVWNEFMSYLGISNANTQKKERLITDEVNANNEQGDASENVYLKNRQDAAEKINALFGLNVSVEMRTTWRELERMKQEFMMMNQFGEGEAHDIL